VIASCGKLQGLNLLGISLKQIENRVHLWEILVDLRLLYLAIEACVLLPFNDDDHTKLMGLYQKFLNLRGLESYHGDWSCDDCKSFVGQWSPSSLPSNFPSLTHCLTTDVKHITLQDVLSNCRNLKFLKYSDIHSLKLPQISAANLRELCIDSMMVGIPDSFMDVISAHGGLVHVVFLVFIVTTEGIATLISNSPKLETCHFYTFFIRTPEGSTPLNLRDYNPILKRRFSNRKLFTCGSCYLTQGQTQGKPSFFRKEDTLNDILIEHNTELASLLP